VIDAVHDNLRNLGLDTLDIVNLRVGDVMRPSKGSIFPTQKYTLRFGIAEGRLAFIGVGGDIDGKVPGPKVGRIASPLPRVE